MGTTAIYATGLRCRVCRAEYPLEPLQACADCWGPLEVAYDYAAMRRAVTPEVIAAGPRSIWRYQPLLPVQRHEAADLGAGFTPLIRARRLGAALGLDNLWLKNDCVNPSYSFKDRVVAVAAAKAIEFGYDTLACASTGNLAGAVAAQAARAGLRAVVFVPADLEPNKLVAATVYGAQVVAVQGTYDQVNRLVTEASDRFGWAFVNVTLRPYYAEGSKTLAYEVAEQLGWRVPDHVVVPIASGALLVKIAKGYRELAEIGLVDGARPVIHGAQAAGCSPVADAFAAGSTTVQPVRPRTIAKSLAIGNPADGPFVLTEVRASGGRIATATDDEIRGGIALLASTEGIFAETAGGVTVAVLAKLARDGVIPRHACTVAYITGNGLKTADAMAAASTSVTSLRTLGLALPRPITIAPTIQALEEALAEWAALSA